jgi:predicted DCC family thiol-disulfide oxidoreductase YuxK
MKQQNKWHCTLEFEWLALFKFYQYLLMSAITSGAELERYLLAYDSDCGPCTRFRRAVGFLDTYGKLDFKSLLRADEEGLLDKIPLNVRHRSFHLIGPDGKVASGANALPKLVSLLPAGIVLSNFLTSAPGGLKATEFVYSVASRLHNTASCNYKPGQQTVQTKRLEILHGNFGFLR